MLEPVVRDDQASHCAGDKAEDEGADHAASFAQMDLSGMTVLSLSLQNVPTPPTDQQRGGTIDDHDPDHPGVW